MTESTSQRAADNLSHDQLADAVEFRDRVVEEVCRVYIGQRQTVEVILAAILARGHVLLEGVPGLAKTTLANATARALGCDFRRVQFTPDLLPADITGTYILNQSTQQFELRMGPLFAQVVLADEINRAPAKTQSALLEAMQERQVTIEGETHPLPKPFVVLATQNPAEQEGVYLLPEAQIDRFLVRVCLGYPTLHNELTMLQTYHRPPAPAKGVSSVDEILALSARVSEVHVETSVLSYALRLVRATREHGRVALGASPRASLGLVQLAKAWALISGRGYVRPDDLVTLAPFALEHRVLVTTDASIEGTTSSAVIEQVLSSTPVATQSSADKTLPPSPQGDHA
ncbi:MAG TPA: hypothetical protein DCQ06_00045 [Myxococcales bacterium]|nr:hypothetical protein [Myxococcales bacterium]